MARRRKEPLGQTIGGVLFGFEQQVFRHQPPPHELVHHARPDDPVPAADGSSLTISLPGDPAPVPAVPTAPEASPPPERAPAPAWCLPPSGT